MPKITVQTEVDIPREAIFYDIASQELVCKLCRTHVTYKLDQPRTRGTNLPFVGKLKAWLSEHAKCFFPDPQAPKDR